MHRKSKSPSILESGRKRIKFTTDQFRELITKALNDGKDAAAGDGYVAANREVVSSTQPASDSIDAIFPEYTDMGSQMAKRESVLIRREIKMMNELGLHARPAAEFIRAANAYRSEIWILKGDERFSATSIIEVLRANLDCGDTATIEAKGPDAAEAVARLVKLVRELREKDLQSGWSLLAEDDY